MIPYSKQNISKEDIRAVTEVLKSEYLTTGPKVEEFELSCKQYFNSKYSLSFNSATSALHVACLSMEITEGDLIWTSPISFVASANCALYCGASIDFVDIDSGTFNICVNSLEDKLIEAKKLKKLPTLIVVVHLAGMPCDMEKIKELSKVYGFKIIEDASHAVGSSYKGSLIGDSKYSDITIFSFHPVKIFTTGEGGMILTNNKNYAKKALLHRAHGITRDHLEFQNKEFEPWIYEQQSLGYNYRMTDISAALGISQLKKVKTWNVKRNKLSNIYKSSFGNTKEIEFQLNNLDSFSSYHLFIIQVNNRKKVFQYLRNKEIGVNVHYIPIHFHPYYKKLGFKEGDFPNAEKYYSKAISIPLYPSLTKKDQNYVIENVIESVRMFG